MVNFKQLFENIANVSNLLPDYIFHLLLTKHIFLGKGNANPLQHPCLGNPTEEPSGATAH